MNSPIVFIDTTIIDCNYVNCVDLLSLVRDIVRLKATLKKFTEMNANWEIKPNDYITKVTSN